MSMNEEQLGQIRQAYEPVVRQCVSISEANGKTITLNGVAPAKTGASWTHIEAATGASEHSITSVCKALRVWVGQTDTQTNGFNAEKVASTFRNCAFWGDLFADVIPTPAGAAPMPTPQPAPQPTPQPAPTTQGVNDLTPIETVEIETHKGEWFARMKNDTKAYKTWSAAMNGATNSLLTNVLRFPQGDEGKSVRASVKEHLVAMNEDNMPFLTELHRNLVSTTASGVGAVTAFIRDHVLTVGAIYGATENTGSTRKQMFDASAFTAFNRN